MPWAWASSHGGWKPAWPSSKFQAKTSCSYQRWSPELPAAEYITSMIGPVRAGVTTVPRCPLIAPRMLSEASQK